MEFKQLRQFYEVCERGSFSKAGESLYMTQQAIGKSMRLLEEELGVVLFIRDKSGVLLTPQGEYLKERCRHLFVYMRETEQVIQQMGANCPLRTAVAFPEAVDEFIKLYPDTLKTVFYDTPFIEIHLTAEDDSEKAVLAEQAGAAIVTAPISHERLQVYPLINIPLCAVMPQKELGFEKHELTLRDFRQKNLILQKGLLRMNGRLFKVFREQNVKPEKISYASGVEEGFSLCSSGEGIFIFPTKGIKTLRPQGLRAVPIKNHSFSMNLFYVFRREDKCQKELIRVYEYLKNHLLV